MNTIKEQTSEISRWRTDKNWTNAHGVVKKKNTWRTPDNTHDKEATLMFTDRDFMTEPQL